MRNTALRATVLLCFIPTPSIALAESGGRQIEEIVVTAERREASISDTSISITAFTSEAIEDFGIRNQEDLQNMVPAAVIEPYDMAIRGVGRNFRNLGGDPGIATYQNGVYSEDFGIASTEGGLFDIERIEFLRGPQGTLYGRNAIGGAVNFINKKPTFDFEGEARGLLGNYSLQEMYGVLSGPILTDLLAARVTGVKRTRDGYYEDLSGNPDPGNYGDENYALALRFTPTDKIELNMRGNERSYRRRMGGADAAGVLALTQNGRTQRDTATYAWGYRGVDPAVPCPDLFTRTVAVPSPGVIGGIGCTVAGQPTFTFTNPTTGNVVTAQRVVAGVDSTDVGTTNEPNAAYLIDPSLPRVVGLNDLDSDDLVTDTNGYQDEFFDHQAFSMDLNWELSDRFSIKYIFGYTDYFYDRTTDTDLTSSNLLDTQFYVSQDTIYESHELQFFIDPTDQLSITAGLFKYKANIRQRGDFFDGTCVDANCLSRYANDDPTGTAPFLAAKTDLTSLEYETGTDRDSMAAYAQAVYTFNDQFALTMGLRWAQDELDGYEDLFYYAEDTIIPLGFDCDPGVGPTCTSTLAATNQALGYLGPNGEILDPRRLLVAGIPTSQSLHRRLATKKTQDWTWRVNLDYEPDDNSLFYISATRGLRSAGFNLVFFSSVASYDPEQLTAYELGYKGTLLNNQMQINAATYYYDYKDVHTLAQSLAFGGYSTTVTAVPKAAMYGLDVDATWLATDNLTLGVHGSYTHSEYQSDHFVIDTNNLEQPVSLFDASANLININGNRMIRVPEYKAGAWAMYAIPIGNAGRIELTTNYSWIDRVYYSVFQRENNSSSGYGRLDLRATWYPTESWMIAAFVNNVADEIGMRQVDHYSTSEDNGYLTRGTPTDPRLAGLEVRYKF